MIKRRMPIMAALALALVVVFTGACNKGSLSPTDTLKAYYDAANKKDVAGLKKHLSQGTLKMMEVGAKNSGKNLDEALKEAPQTPTPKFTNEKITGDTATVDIVAEGQTMSMPFVKEGGEWKIAMDKFIEKLQAPTSDTTSKPLGDPRTGNTGDEDEGHEEGKP